VEGAPQPGPQGGQAAGNLQKLVERCAEQLCDYEIVFNDFYGQMKARADAIARGSQELKTLQDDQETASALVALFGQQQQATSAALKAQQAERKDTEDLYKRLDEKQRTLKTDVGETRKANEALAAEIAKLQLEARRRIQQQTGDVVQLPGTP
jgi:chromosome segregation ATPase